MFNLDEAIKRYTNNAEYERTHGSLQGCLEFRQLAEWLKELKQLREQQPCEEAISRQEAIKSIEEKAKRIKNGDTLNGLAGAVAILFDLPSVNPQPSGDLISRQTSFETPEQEPLEVEATKLQQAYNKGFEDCRQGAVLLASDLKQDLPDDEHIADMVMAHNEGILEYQTQLSLLPPVTPQLKTGHWIEKDDNLYECSECGQYIYSEAEHDLLEFHTFCGRCGAKMIEPQESEEV